MGTGAYATVKQAVHKTTGLLLAIKIYEKYRLMEAAKKKSVLREINALSRLGHPNIMRLFDVIETPKQVYLVLEFAPGKMLSTYLRERLQTDKPRAENTTMT